MSCFAGHPVFKILRPFPKRGYLKRIDGSFK